MDHFRIQKVNAVDDETGIEDAYGSYETYKTLKTYDLSGREVTGQLRKGIYVAGGRKVLF